MATYHVTPLRVLEAWEDATGLRTVHRSDVALESLEDWLKPKLSSQHPQRKYILRVIFCNYGARKPNHDQGPNILHQICDGFGLHWTTREAFRSNNGSFAQHCSRNAATGEMAMSHIVVKVPNMTIGSHGLSQVYSRHTDCTHALLYGFPDGDYKRLKQYLTSESYLDVSSRDFVLLPSLILRYYREAAEDHRHMIDKHIFKTEMALNYAVPGSLVYQYGATGNARPDPDRLVQKLQNSPDDYMRKLHLCQIELVALTHASNFGKDFGVFLRNVLEETDAMQPITRSEDARSVAAHEYMLHDIDFQINLWSTLLSQKSALKERTQIHINLIFGLMAQDENRLSRSVAQKSGMIAAASKKDSAAMRTLAVLTTIFLPPTFVATLFSMNMFNWTADSSSDPVTSKYLWIYWAVAIPLTAVVLMIWRLWWSLEDKKYQKELEKTE